MKLPRDLDGAALIRALARHGYAPTRQSGSHVRLTRVSDQGQQHLTVPLHRPLRVGTLNGILTDAAAHLGLSRDELLERL